MNKDRYGKLTASWFLWGEPLCFSFSTPDPVKPMEVAISFSNRSGSQRHSEQAGAVLGKTMAWQWKKMWYQLNPICGNVLWNRLWFRYDPLENNDSKDERKDDDYLSDMGIFHFQRDVDCWKYMDFGQLFMVPCSSQSLESGPMCKFSWGWVKASKPIW